MTALTAARSESAVSPGKGCTVIDKRYGHSPATIVDYAPDWTPNMHAVVVVTLDRVEFLNNTMMPDCPVFHPQPDGERLHFIYDLGRCMYREATLNERIGNFVLSESGRWLYVGRRQYREPDERSNSNRGPHHRRKWPWPSTSPVSSVASGSRRRGS